MLNTIKTSIGFLGSIIWKYLPLKSKDSTVDGIFNYLNYSDVLSSSGQPTKEQFSVIRNAGYSVVINLAPYDLIENYLKDEELIVTKLEMRYVHIPVNIFKPTKENFEKFVKEIQKSDGEKIWVHCAANMRASAFVFKYRCSVLKESKEDAIWPLREIWEPVGAWKRFLFGDSKENL